MWITFLAAKATPGSDTSRHARAYVPFVKGLSEVKAEGLGMGAEQATPCRHAGAPPADVVARVATLMSTLDRHGDVLATHGITIDEFRHAWPAALESLRGQQSAKASAKREFLAEIFEAMVSAGHVEAYEKPKYGSDTVYRLRAADRTIAIIQKGCPDGKHSSVAWTAPDWADETYLWWLCSSLAAHPGEHVVKGINRLRQRFFADQSDTLTGVIFHNQLCGTSERVCPKSTLGELELSTGATPLPCLYLMPSPGAGPEFNWRGERTAQFPEILAKTWGQVVGDVSTLTGYVGFRVRGKQTSTIVTARYGRGRTTTARKQDA